MGWHKIVSLDNALSTTAMALLRKRLSPRNEHEQRIAEKTIDIMNQAASDTLKKEGYLK